MQIRSDILFHHNKRLIDSHAPEQRTRCSIPNRALIPVLIPMFLIISSSVYPAIISGIQDKEMQIISEAMADEEQQQQKKKDKYNDAASRYQALMHIQMNSHSNITPSSPTSAVGPTFPSIDSVVMHPQNEEDNKMKITSIESGKAVHTIWEDNTPGNSEIFYKRDGADYDPSTINISNNAGISNLPAISVSGNNVHVVWEDNTAGDIEILYRRSFDGGATFSPTINLSNNAAQSTRPGITVSGNNVYVVWDDLTPGNFDIFYKRSTDGGASFTEPTKNLSNNVGSSVFPAIATSGNNVHVTWEDTTPGEDEIFYRRSIDSGATFPNVIKNLSGNAGESERPSIGVSGSSVHVVWRDDTPGPDEIFYRRSIDSGATFPNVIKNLSGNSGFSVQPAIAVSGNNVHVIWEDDTGGNRDILYRRSTDGGDSFAASIKNLSSNAGFSFDSAIALSGNNVYVVWSDDTNGISEILYRTSSNIGTTFPSLLTNLSVTAGSSFAPSIAAS